MAYLPADVPRLNIAVIGHSGAGKSTYLAAIPRTLTAGLRRITVRAGDATVGTASATDRRRIRRGRHPSPTTRRVVYEFVARYRRVDFLTLVWHDYGGDLLRQRVVEAGVRHIHHDLANADGIVIVLDAFRLVHDDRARRDVRRLVVLAQRSLERRRERVPVVVMYTRGDRVRYPRERVRAMEPMAEFAAAIRAADWVNDVTVWVSCTRWRRKYTDVPILWVLASAMADRFIHNGLPRWSPRYAYDHRSATWTQSALSRALSKAISRRVPGH